MGRCGRIGEAAGSHGRVEELFRIVVPYRLAFRHVRQKLACKAMIIGAAAGDVAA